MTVEQQLAALRELAEAGLPVEGERLTLLTKAFRLKRFGRCPECDAQGVQMFDDVVRQALVAACPSCGWGKIVTLRAAAEADDTVLEMVK